MCIFLLPKVQVFLELGDRYCCTTYIVVAIECCQRVCITMSQLTSQNRPLCLRALNSGSPGRGADLDGQGAGWHEFQWGSSQIERSTKFRTTMPTASHGAAADTSADQGTELAIGTLQHGCCTAMTGPHPLLPHPAKVQATTATRRRRPVLRYMSSLTLPTPCTMDPQGLYILVDLGRPLSMPALFPGTILSRHPCS